MGNKYAGADWIASTFKCEMSPLGIAAADLLGDVWLGIYHLPVRPLSRVNWAHVFYVELSIYGSMATFDDDILTRLVILSHDRCLRVELRPCNMRLLKIHISPRQRHGVRYWQRMPELDEHVQAIRNHYGVEVTPALVGIEQ